MKQVFLICNAHLDPVWQWQWEEGAAAAVSTFRAAADLIEQFDTFVFSHNEALLYQWVEEYEPELFARIQRLVKAGRWRIMGGWFLQPDCNMPCGESIIRQIRAGQRYFKEKFGVRNTTAVSFDAFGHSRGIVRILRDAGYDSYLFMRPHRDAMPLPADDFIWTGLDGAEVQAHRINTGYNSPLGGAGDKLTAWLHEHADTEIGLVPWGVGNHGGGPSRKDIADIDAIIAREKDIKITHSTPEEYFAAWSEKRTGLKRVNTSLRTFAAGCYTSQIQIKQQHRLLENMLLMTEKMLSAASINGLLSYPLDDVKRAERDLLTCEFHDILPGTSIQPGEAASLRQLSHGQEILSRLRARAFFALASGQKPAAPGEIPVLVYNPHPYPVDGDFSCEFMLADQNWKEEFTLPSVWHDGARVPSQCEKEESNLPLDWRKKVVFHATLAPMAISRFDCRMEILPHKPIPSCPATDTHFCFDNGRMLVDINRKTGLVDRYCVDGIEYLKPGACRALVIRDSEDPWSMNASCFRDVIGEFSTMSESECASFAGVAAESLAAVRVIEDGAARTVIEALLSYGHSFLVMTYRLPKQGAQFELGLRVLFAEKDRMLKLALPTAFADEYAGQTMFGTESLPIDGSETVSQKWCAAISRETSRALTVANDCVYGSDFTDGEIRLSLLRSAGYTAHPIGDRKTLPQDRFSPRIDQGERLYTFRIQGGTPEERLSHIDRESLAMNEAPYSLSFFPSGLPGKICRGVELSDDAVQLTSFSLSEDGGYVLRLFEPSGMARETEVSIPALGIAQRVSLRAYEVKTLSVDISAKRLVEASILS